MSRFRDPVLVSQFAAALLGVLVAFQLGVNDEQAGLWLGAIDALFALGMAFVVRPVVPSVVTGAVTATAMLVVGYGFEITPERLSAVNLAITMGMAFFAVRPNSTPIKDPQSGQGVPPAVVVDIKKA